MYLYIHGGWLRETRKIRCNELTPSSISRSYIIDRFHSPEDNDVQ